MRIDLNNYEEWMIDYLDGNLSDQESKEMKAFLLKHPHIAEEVDGLLDVRLNTSDEIKLNSSVKNKLIQADITPTEHISEENYQDIFIAYYENDLEDSRKSELSNFLEKNEQLKYDFELYSKPYFKANKSIVFPDKDSLLQKEKKLIPLWIWPSVAAAVIIIGFWIGNMNQKIRPVYSPAKINSINIQSVSVRDEVIDLPFRKSEKSTSLNTEKQEPIVEKRSTPLAIKPITISKVSVKDNSWQIQMELMQAYAFNKNQFQSQVDWASIPSERSKKGFRLISSFLWKTTKAQVQSISEEVLNNELQAISSTNLESITGGIISVKKPTKEVE